VSVFMQTEMEKTFRNLKVIASIKQNDKLITESDIFELHPPTLSRTVYRIYYRENREANLSKIQTCIRESKSFVEKIASSREDSETFSGRMFLMTQSKLCQRMMDSLRDIIPGMRNLAVTYRDDAGAIAKIDLLIDEINDFLLVTNSLLQMSLNSNSSIHTSIA
jgi:hypothetical protein